MSLGLITKAQIPLPNTNIPDSTKKASVVYKNLNGQYDFLVAYTTESFWWSYSSNYKIVAFKNGAWFKGSLSAKKNKNDTWSKPQIKLRLINSASAKKITDQMFSMGLLRLNTDSLKINKRIISPKAYSEYHISDGVNYKFEIFDKIDFVIIEAYEPDYFFSKIPEIKSREVFIRIRDQFLLDYEVL